MFPARPNKGFSHFRMASATTHPPDEPLPNARLSASSSSATPAPADNVPRAEEVLAEPQSSHSPTVVRIEPPRGWFDLRLRELWDFRELLYFFVWRDVKVRYKQTVLGVLWAVIQPLLLMLIFTLLLGRLAGLSKGEPAGIPYPVLVFAGLVPWTLFSAAITACSGALVTNSNLVTKVYFPRLILPIASAGSYLV